MPVTEKKYPEWVQQYRKRGTTIKKRGDCAHFLSAYVKEIKKI